MKGMPVARVVPELALAPLAAVSAAGLIHRGVVESPADVRQPNGEYVRGWTVDSPAEPMWMAAAGSTAATLAEAQGVRAQWTIRTAPGRSLRAGQRVLVTGYAGGCRWQRLVRVTSPSGPTGRVRAMAFAVDEELQ